MQEFRKKYKVEVPPTNENEELVYYYNEKHEKLGIIPREEAIQKGLLIQAVQLWIYNPKMKSVLLQRRSSQKKHDPNLIDASSAGHVNITETETQSVIREAKEEVGVTEQELLNGNLTKIIETSNLDFRKEKKGYYFLEIYLSILNYPLEKYKKQENEVEELFFMDYEEFKDKIRQKAPELSRIVYNEATEELFAKIDEKIRVPQKEHELEE